MCIFCEMRKLSFYEDGLAILFHGLCEPNESVIVYLEKRTKQRHKELDSLNFQANLMNIIVPVIKSYLNRPIEQLAPDVDVARKELLVLLDNEIDSKLPALFGSLN